LIETSSGGISRKGLIRLGKSFAGNLVLIGFLAGLAARFSGITPSGTLKSVIELGAASALPCAPFAMGVSLKHYGIRGAFWLSAVIWTMKLLVHPFIVFRLTRYVFEMPPVFAGVAVVFAAMPSGINSYLMAERYRAGVPATAGAVSLSTALAVLSVSLWLWLLGVGVH